MEKIIDRLLKVKNEDDFWFDFFATKILEEFDFDYKQESDLLREQINDLEQENDELSDQVDELENQNRQLQDIIDDSIQEVKFYD